MACLAKLRTKRLPADLMTSVLNATAAAIMAYSMHAVPFETETLQHINNTMTNMLKHKLGLPKGTTMNPYSWTRTKVA